MKCIECLEVKSEIFKLRVGGENNVLFLTLVLII